MTLSAHDFTGLPVPVDLLEFTFAFADTLDDHPLLNHGDIGLHSN